MCGYYTKLIYINHLWKLKAGLILHINYLGDGKNIYINFLLL